MTTHRTPDWAVQRITVMLESGPEERLGIGPPGCGWVMVAHGLGSWAVIHGPSGLAVIFGLPCTLEAMRLTEMLSALAPSAEPQLDKGRVSELMERFAARTTLLCGDLKLYLARVARAANRGRDALETGAEEST